MEVPKTKKAELVEKISVCLDKETKELYEVGKRNGHDTTAFARNVLREAFKKAEATLKTPA